MSKAKSAILVCVFMAIAALASEETNSLKTSKVGDWASYSSLTKMGEVEFCFESKQMAISKTDEEVTVEVVTSVLGQETKQKLVMKLNEPFDPRKQMLDQGIEMDVKEIASGEDELELAGKKLKTKWTQFEGNGTAKAMPVQVKLKVWLCASVPLGGLAKMTSEIKNAGMTTMVLKDFGRGQ